jgi:hypothetical protein
MIDKIKKALTGFRKFIVMMLLILIGVSFRLTDLVNGSEMVELLKVTGAAFMAANLVEHVTEVIKQRMGDK